MMKRTGKAADFTKTGRPTKKTKEVQARVVQAIEMGATKRLAALYAGIGETLLYEWQAEDAEFSETIRAAEGKRSIRWLATIEKAANDGSWSAAAWKLERTYPEEYGRKTRTEITGKDEGPVQVEHAGSVELNDVLSKLTTEALDAIVSAIDQAEAEAEDAGG